MNFKMLIPDYRLRFLCILNSLSKKFITKGDIFLDIGCGEADLHSHYIKYFKHGIGLDVNRPDIDFAQKLNNNLSVKYDCRSFESIDSSKKYDCIICSEVIEHVEDPKKLIKKVSKILKKDGVAIFTFPRFNFPFFYDPVNFFLKKLNKHISFGAYAFGHDKLIEDDFFLKTITSEGFKIIEKKNLGGAFISILQLYWVGLFQQIIKSNKGNSKLNNKSIFIRPSSNIPFFVFITDILIKIDQLFTFKNSRSIGVIYVLTK